MLISHDSDNYLSHGVCGCADCEANRELFYDDEESIFDDPYDVVMYDLDFDDDLYSLISMLGDTAKSWYARRRINALSAAGPLSALVADIIIDSLGRRWNPLLHPRDRYGRFIETGGFFRWLSRGKWLRAQVTRIDSDGKIHARSKGNDGIPDGTAFQFDPKQAAKFVKISTEKADLTPDAIDLDSEIPDFPEASATQRRIYNVLQWGDMPVEDLDEYRPRNMEDVTGSDIAGEILELEERDLISIDRSIDKPRVRRNDADQLGVVSVGDDEIDDVPEDDVPEDDDIPALTRQQRDLLDTIVESDRGEGDGVTLEELGDVDGDDIQALVDAGALTSSDDRFHLVNPEGDGEAGPNEQAAEPDLSMEIFEAAGERFEDFDQQEAFQHYAEELARPGDENNIPLPDGITPAKRRAAEQAAQAWWEGRNASEVGDNQEVEQPVAPEEVAPEQRDVINPDNGRIAQDIMDNWFPGQETWLDSAEGQEYTSAIRQLLDAEDLDEAGETERANLNRQVAYRKLARLGFEEHIDGWPQAIRDWRNDERNVAVEPESVPEDVANTPDVPETEQPVGEGPVAPIALMDRPSAKLYLRDHPRAQALLDEGASEYEWGYEAAELDLDAGLSSMTREEADSLWGPAYSEGYFDAVNDQGRAVPDAAPEPIQDVGAEETSAPEVVPETDVGLEQNESPEPIGISEQIDVPEPDAAPEPESVQESEQPIDGETDPDVVITSDQAGEIEWNELFADWESEQMTPEQRSLLPGTPAPEPGADDAVQLDDHPDRLAIINQNPFNIEDFPELTQEGGGLVDRNGERVELGAWYKANRGGEGDLGVSVGFYNQEEFPGWILIRMPDDKYKAVHVVGSGVQSGMNKVHPNALDNEIALWRAQRQAKWGEEVAQLAQLDEKNIMADGQPAAVGMAIDYLGGGAKIQGAERAIIARISLDKVRRSRDLEGADGKPVMRNGKKVREYFNPKDNNGNPLMEVNVHILTPGAKSERDLVKIHVSKIRQHTPTPTPTPEPTPSPNVPDQGPNEIPNRAWPVPSDQELLERIQVLGGDVDWVDFANGFQNPGAVHDQMRALVDNGALEFNPEVVDGRPRIRVPGEGERVPSTPALPDGAQNEFEGRVLNDIDAADEPLPIVGLVNLDDDDAGERLNAVIDLVNRGVLQERVLDDGRRAYERAVETPEQVLPDGAENELEGNLLNVIDGLPDGAVGSDLVDLDAEDAADRLEALRRMVDRGVLVRTVRNDGRPGYRRAPSAASPASNSFTSRAHDPARGTDAGGQPMSRAEATEALRAGADPLTVNTDDLYNAMKDSGRFEFVGFRKDGNIGGTEWAIDNQVDGPFQVHAGGADRSGRAYVVKRPRESNVRGNWRSELYAAAISQNVGLTDGDPGANSGGLFQPQTTSASTSHIIMENYTYKFPQGTTFPNVKELTPEERREAAPDRIRLVLYDYMINNSLDRHSYNQIFARLPDGSLRVVAIDNGLGDGENYSKKNPDMSFREFLDNSGVINQSVRLLGSVGEFNNGLTREDLRAIVTSFYDRYGNLNPAAILESLSRSNLMTDDDMTPLETWVNAAKTRVESIGSDVDSVVNLIANIIGAP